MWWRILLRHCATSRKVPGSIPDGVTGIFHWHNPSGHILALGLTQPLTEMSTMIIYWGVKVAGAYGWQPCTFMCRLSSNLGASTSWNPQGLSRPVMGLLYLYSFLNTCLVLITVNKQGLHPLLFRLSHWCYRCHHSFVMSRRWMIGVQRFETAPWSFNPLAIIQRQTATSHTHSDLGSTPDPWCSSLCTWHLWSSSCCACVQWIVDSFNIRAFNARGVIKSYLSVGIKVAKWRCAVVRFVKLFFE